MYQASRLSHYSQSQVPATLPAHDPFTAVVFCRGWHHSIRRKDIHDAVSLCSMRLLSAAGVFVSSNPSSHVASTTVFSTWNDLGRSGPLLGSYWMEGVETEAVARTICVVTRANDVEIDRKI
jgi:hypothetical protein